MQGTADKAMRTLRHGWVGLLLLAGAQVAGAGVIGNGTYSVGGDLSGFAGEGVSMTIHESDLTGFNGALLRFSFDSTVLSFGGVDRDCSTLPTAPDNCSLPDFESDSNGIATYSLLVTTSPPDINGAADLFTLLFTIDAAAAPGNTVVSFSNFYTDAALQDPDYAGTYDRQSLTGTITVLAGNAVPTPGTAGLALTALGLLAVCRRRTPPRLTARARLPA